MNMTSSRVEDYTIWMQVAEQTDFMKSAVANHVRLLDGTPSLTDLMKLWCEETFIPRVAAALSFTPMANDQTWSVLYLRSRAIAYVYDDFILLLDSKSLVCSERIPAADPAFFDKLGKHLVARAKDPANPL